MFCIALDWRKHRLSILSFKAIYRANRFTNIKVFHWLSPACVWRWGFLRYFEWCFWLFALFSCFLYYQGEILVTHVQSMILLDILFLFHFISFYLHLEIYAFFVFLLSSIRLYQFIIQLFHFLFQFFHRRSFLLRFENLWLLNYYVVISVLFQAYRIWKCYIFGISESAIYRRSHVYYWLSN